MGKVFISHSRHDKELVDIIKQIIENLGHKVYLYEYEKHPEESSPDEIIRQEICASDFVFCFLTKNIDKREHTKAWVISEVTIARDCGKRTFVFERENEYVSFPLPYLTDYMIFDNENIQHILKIQKIAKKQFEKLYTLPPEIVGGGAGALIGGALFGPLGLILGGLGGAALGAQAREAEVSMVRIQCPWCKMWYNYYSPWIKRFPCPKCRRWIKLS